MLSRSVRRAPPTHQRLHTAFSCSCGKGSCLLCILQLALVYGTWAPWPSCGGRMPESTNRFTMETWETWRGCSPCQQHVSLPVDVIEDRQHDGGPMRHKPLREEVGRWRLGSSTSLKIGTGRSTERQRQVHGEIDGITYAHRLNPPRQTDTMEDAWANVSNKMPDTYYEA
ncbi:hypothetical protein OH76DRAFT_14640 [Lentinus brumalis]|uniref:Uncharacterized protein n=1 Tax=Lentinus brumalis TaxID=2498619 RepID=A0A371DX05_9APHY|nr:hypothetical protein OH76DRAFT_14640 [Polyporus brumalis]